MAFPVCKWLTQVVQDSKTQQQLLQIAYFVPAILAWFPLITVLMSPADQGRVLEVCLGHDHHHGQGPALPLHLLPPPGNVLQGPPVSHGEGQQTKIGTSGMGKL